MWHVTRHVARGERDCSRATAVLGAIHGAVRRLSKTSIYAFECDIIIIVVVVVVVTLSVTNPHRDIIPTLVLMATGTIVQSVRAGDSGNMNC